MLNTNQEIIIEAIFSFNTTAEARDSVAGVLSAAQFNSGLGALKRMGLIEKNEDGNYSITELGYETHEFPGYAQPLEMDEPAVIEGELMNAEIVVAEPKAEEIPEILEGEFEVVSEEIQPLVSAPMVYDHYKALPAPPATKKSRKTKGQVTPKAAKAPKMSTDELKEHHEELNTLLNINPDFIRIVDMNGGSWMSTRFSKNGNRIKALETFKAGHHRVYVGKISEDLMAAFETIADHIKVAPNGLTAYIDFKFGSPNLAAIKELLGEIVND